VDFHEEAVDTRRRACPCEVRDETCIAARAIALPSGRLHTVGDIEHDRVSELTQDGERTEIHNQIVVTEAGAPLSEHYPVGTGLQGLREHLSHLGRREELSLLEVDDPAAARSRPDQVRLAAQECRYLKYIQHRCRSGDLAGFVNVAKDR
jgi:hypothetical protein